MAPLTVEMLPDWAAMTRDLRVGTAELVIDVDVEEVLVVVAVTLVILPPETVIETVTVPYWCVTVGPANVPFLNPLAGAAVVAFAVVAAVVALAAVVAGAAVVPAFVAAAVVPAAVVPAAVVPAAVVPAAAALAAALDVAPATEAESDADADAVVSGSVPGVWEASDAAAPDASVDAKDVESVALAGTPAKVVWPPNVAADHAAARMPADVATAAALPRALTRRTSRYGWRWTAYRPPVHRR